MSRRDVKTVLFHGPADLAGPAASTFNTVAGRMGLPWVADTGEPTREAAWVVTIGSAHTPNAAEHWPVDAGADAAAQLEREVMHLVARLLGGGKPRDPAAVAPPPAAPAPAPSRKGHTVRVGRETKGRRGKGVTTVFGLPLDDAGLRELAGVLKQRCGTGGTVKDGVIEIQGDQRDRISAELEKLGYKVKPSGG